MKKLLFILIIAVIGSIYIYENQSLTDNLIHKYLYYSPCNTPVSYHEGSVDPRFGISPQEFLVDMRQATNIWDTAYHKTLFTYNSKSPLSVSLVYDQRQTLDTQINQLQGQINNDKQTIQPQVSQYQQMLNSFEQKMNNLNNQIAYWNSKGGAPANIYAQLNQQQQALQAQSSQLNAMASQLNQSTNTFNNKVGQLNQTVQNFNAALAKTPEEGLYDGLNNTITIYFDNSQTELIHTLAHEFGHSLGLGHNQNTQSIMYPYTNLIVVPSPNDLAALNAICQEKSIWQIFLERFAYVYQTIKTQIQTVVKQNQ